MCELSPENLLALFLKDETASRLTPDSGTNRTSLISSILWFPDLSVHDMLTDPCWVAVTLPMVSAIPWTYTGLIKCTSCRMWGLQAIWVLAPVSSRNWLMSWFPDLIDTLWAEYVMYWSSMVSSTVVAEAAVWEFEPEDGFETFLALDASMMWLYRLMTLSLVIESELEAPAVVFSFCWKQTELECWPLGWTRNRSLGLFPAWNLWCLVIFAAYTSLNRALSVAIDAASSLKRTVTWGIVSVLMPASNCWTTGPYLLEVNHWLAQRQTTGPIFWDMGCW